MTQSSSGLQKRGRPDALVEASHLAFQYCGGSGAGSCLDPLVGRSTFFLIEVPKFIAYNRRLVLLNDEVTGLRFWNDAGSDGICSHSMGSTEYPFWLAFSDGNSGGFMTDEEIENQGIQLSGALPYEIEVPADKLPQPVLPGGGPNPEWTSVIYVHVLWKEPGLINEGGDIGKRSLRVVKHDYDIVI